MPDLNVAVDGIDFEYFKFIVTSMYMRVLNQFCDFKDGLNIDMQSETSVNTGQFKAQVTEDYEEEKQMKKITDVRLCLVCCFSVLTLYSE